MMTRKRLRWALLIPLLLAVCGGAQAQITAAQSIPGFYVQQGTDGCTAVTGCFIPYSATYPLPTTGGGGGSNASVGATGSAVPGSATYLGINIAGTLTGLTAGQATMANSVPVVIASNQSPVPVTQGTSPWVDDITQWANVALGAPSNYGTSPGAVNVPGVNAFVTNTIAVTDTTSGAVTNPTSTLTMTSATTAYTAGQLIATNATAGSVVNPSFAIATSAGGAAISRLRLSTNDTTSTAWGGQVIQIDLWTATPTWTNGDRAAWSPATGVGSHLGAYTCTMSAEYGDGAYAECAPNVGSTALPKLASGTSIFWTLDAITGSGVTGASKAWTIVAELLN